MSEQTWTRLKADAITTLSHASPALAMRPADLAALSAIVALARVKLSIRATAGSLRPRLVATPRPKDDAHAIELLGLIARVAEDHLTRPDPDSSPAFGAWIEQHGFPELTIALLNSAGGVGQLNEVAAIVSDVTGSLAARSAKLSLAHMNKIAARDLQLPMRARNRLSGVSIWLLAPETSGRPRRADALKRRVQAMSHYGALSHTLCETSISEAIDQGQPLAPLLMKRHSLKTAELRALRGARSLARSIDGPSDFHDAVQELKAHEIPPHEWPGGGLPDRPEDWEHSVWTRGERHNFVRPDYLGDNPQAIKDAIDALCADLLRPLVAERIRVGAVACDYHVSNFARAIELDRSDAGSETRRRLLAALRHAIVGPRRPKAFHEAVGLWHRRVASLSALRHERHADRPGWPALCAPWRSVCGRFDIVVLASAADLVEEGRALDHCVGGYYDICRRGDTQILSLREEGQPVATVELVLARDFHPLTLQVGQFKARRNTSPAPHLHEPLRAFLREIRSGAHAVDAARIARYRKHMRDRWDGSWRADALTLAHAREVFHFYLPLLPRGMPDDFDAWSDASGLKAAIDATLADLAVSPRNG